MTARLIVDVHTHVFPDRIAAQVVGQISDELNLPAVLGGTVGDLLAHMDACGVDRSVCLAVAPRPDLVRNTNRWLIEQGRASGGRLVPLGTLHPEDPDWEGEIQRLVDAGVRGIKMHAAILRTPPDDEGWMAMYGRLPDGFVVLFHGGDPATPRRVAQVASTFPQLRIVAAHLGDLDDPLSADVWEHLVGRPVYLDTSAPPGLSRVPRSHLEQLVEAHGAQRILFGTDSPFAHQGHDRAVIESLAISPAAKEAILGRNAQELLGLD